MDYSVYLALIRLGIGHPTVVEWRHVDWRKIQALAVQQGLSAVIIDGIEALPEDCRPPKTVLLKWIGETLQGYEYRYELYKRTIADLSSVYNSKGYKMMVLKGYACSLDWPKPEHRPNGDIDIWLFGKQREADAFLHKEKGIVIDNSHHHHSIFMWRDFIVENHYDFVNVHTRKSNAEIEKVFKELGMDDSYYVSVYGQDVFIPSPNLHALFLLKHAASHFVGANINLRQVLDWAFFVEKHTEEVDWGWFLGMLDKYHLRDFFNYLNAICVDDLGFKSNIFPELQFNPELKARVFEDIMSPEFSASTPKGIVKRILYKYRRWKGNAWKYKMCFQERRGSSFWKLVFSKIMKPASI